MWKLKIQTTEKTTIIECKDKKEMFETVDNVQFLERIGLYSIKLIVACEKKEGQERNFITIVQK